MEHAPNPLHQYHHRQEDNTVTTPGQDIIDHVIPSRGTHPASSQDLVDMIRSKAQRAPTLPDDYFNDIHGDVLDAMENVSRSYYLPDTTLAATRYHASNQRSLEPTTEFTYPRDTIPQPAYYDTTLPIGHDQTMSQPSVIAYMNSLLDLDKGDHAYEIGTGSGYHAAITAEQVGNTGRLITTERQPELFHHGQRKLNAADHDADITVNAGDGIDDLLHRDDTFDHVYATAGIPGDTDIPIERLRRRLRPGGTLLLPQQDGPLLHYTEGQDNPAKRSHAIFVPLKTRWNHAD